MTRQPAALAWMANYGAIELHPWTSTARRPAPADVGLIDIDPGTKTTFDDVFCWPASTAPPSITSAWSAARR